MKTSRFFCIFFCLLLLLNLTVPALAAEDDFGDFDVAAKAALLIDPETEEILYARNIHERLYPASLTKIMTCLLVLEAVDSGNLTLDTVLTASETAVTSIPADGSTAGLKVGEQLSVENLLYCIMLSSANEGCNILAEGVAGSIDAFVDQMNQRAAALGCEDTSFVNTNGLPDENHYTTAWDLYLITREARKHPDFMPIVGTATYQVPATNMSESRTLRTTNYLLSGWYTSGYIYKGAEGIKTGSTSAAGYCLVASATRSGRSLLSVVMGADRITLDDGTILTQSFSETVRLYDWGFGSFTRQVILSNKELIGEVPVTLSQEQDFVKMHPAEEIERLFPKDVNPEKAIERTITLKAETVEAPVEKGQVLGTVTLTYNGSTYATVDLLADEAVAASRFLVLQRDILDFLHRPVLWISIGGVVGAVALFYILRAVLKSRRRRYGKAAAPARRPGYRGRRR
ncbi:MAG: D-alanyl-D-alanine carboxypeptidase [Oscillospiraceae bacterium]|nr:D-alanyl-D-alanine carboxypeptidase [Oscillospiraceae bacterium]